RRDDDLRRLPRPELSRRNPPRAVPEADGDELSVAGVLEPVVAGEQVRLPVAIHVVNRDPFLVRLALRRRPERAHRPGGRRARVGRNLGQEEGPRALVPEGELRPRLSLEVAERLIVVLPRPALLDQVLLPGNARVEARRRVLVPPDFVTLVVATEHQVQVAVAIDVRESTARLGRAHRLVDDVLLPAVPGVAHPDDGSRLRPLGEDDVVDAV